MNMVPRLVAIFLLAGSSISFFKYERPVQLSGSGQQYVVVDESVWQHTRDDLGDLRLYSGSSEVPYSLLSERGAQERERKNVPVLQQLKLDSGDSLKRESLFANRFRLLS